MAKLWSGHWNLPKGGLVSAHSALAFFCFITVVFVSSDPIVWVLALVLAILVAQSRVEAGIHNMREVLIGAVVALALGGLMYTFLGNARGRLGRGDPGVGARHAFYVY